MNIPSDYKEVVIGPGPEGEIATFALGKIGKSYAIPMGVNNVNLYQKGDQFIISVNIYDEEIHTVEASREEVLEALGWETI